MEESSIHHYRSRVQDLGHWIAACLWIQINPPLIPPSLSRSFSEAKPGGIFFGALRPVPCALCPVL